MTDFTFPALTRAAPGAVEWSIVWNTQVFASPLSNTVRTIEIAGARWQVAFQLSSLKEPDAAVLQAHLMQLRGRVHRSLIYPWQRPIPRGTIAGTPLVKGASQTGASLLIDGCTVGTTLLKGDFFSVNSELKMITADATANGSGEMTLAFEPPLRSAPADNAPLTTTRPTAAFMATEDTVRWSARPGVYSDFSLQFIEAFA